MGNWSKVFFILLSIFIIQYLFFLFLSLLIRSFIIFGLEKIWMQEIWKFRLNFFRKSGGFVLEILSKYSFKLGYNIINKVINLWKYWSIFLIKKRGWRLLNIFLTNINQLYSSILSDLVYTKVWAFFKKIKWNCTSLQFYQYQTW